MRSSQCCRLGAGAHRGLRRPWRRKPSSEACFSTGWPLLRGEPCPTKAHSQKSYRTEESYPSEEGRNVRDSKLFSNQTPHFTEGRPRVRGCREKATHRGHPGVVAERRIAPGRGGTLFIHSQASDARKETASRGKALQHPADTCHLHFDLHNRAGNSVQLGSDP